MSRKSPPSTSVGIMVPPEGDDGSASGAQREISSLQNPLEYTSEHNPRSLSANASTTGMHSAQELEQRQYFRSRRLKPGQVLDQPWKNQRDPREKWVTIIPLAGLAIGLALAALLVIQGLLTVQNHSYKLVLDEDWSKLDLSVWTQESNVGGFGNHEFDQATSTNENLFIKNGNLHIKPSLQDSQLITQNNTLSLKDCTGTTFLECNAVTNTTNGTIIPPIKSGRIHTKRGPHIKYGRVEVTATLPSGDWFWPAIWMMPVNSTYGDWPRSGEIDIMESRGNNWTYAQGGSNVVSSALHWGPDQTNDAWWRTNNKRQALHSSFADKPHTFGLEWSQKYLYTYLDNRLLQILYTPLTKSLWTRVHFPYADTNGSMITNPWVKGAVNAPFDQPFYLIINLAVGGTNGWFEDGKSGKPWVDISEMAAKDFWDARDQWYPTWKRSGEFIIGRVRMWQQID